MTEEKNQRNSSSPRRGPARDSQGPRGKRHSKGKDEEGGEEKEIPRGPSNLIGMRRRGGARRVVPSKRVKKLWKEAGRPGSLRKFAIESLANPQVHGVVAAWIKIKGV